MTSRQIGNRHPNSFLLIILLLTITLYVVVFFDIPIARQVIGFLYLTFVPGFALLRLFRLETTSLSKVIIFSVGLSLAILMIGGLLVNEIGPATGISRPLSETPLILMFSGMALLFSFLSLYISRESRAQIGDSLKLIVRSPFVLVLLILPFISILGTIWMNAYGDNLILLVMIVMIASLFAIGTLSKRLLPPKLYPLAVIVIAISLLFHSSLISSYVQPQGSDIPREYFLFRITEENARWESSFAYYWDIHYGRFNQMLSITILPTIYSSLLNMDAAWILKILYPLFFSLVPIGLFHFWLPRVGKRYAFIATFLFMAQETFYTEALSLARQMVAELFFVLLLIVVSEKKMKNSTRWIAFVLFSIALVMSHYAIAVIFLFFLFVVWAVLFATRRTTKNITLPMIVFFLVATFAWYIYTSNASSFDSILSFSNEVYAQLGRFFDISSRGSVVLSGLGIEAAPSIWNVVSRAIAYFIQFLIVIGFIGVLRRRAKANVDQEFLLFTQIAIVLLAMLILVPGLAETLNMTRFYHILLFFLAPFCLLGAESLVKVIFGRRTELKASILLLTVLVSYFLFQTSFVYELVGSESWSLSLSGYRMSELKLYGVYGYIDEQSVFGAQWLRKNVEVEQTPIYADRVSHYAVLTSYGMIYQGFVEELTNTTEVMANGTIYLSRLNVVYGTIVGARQLWNSSDLSFLRNMNKIYSNGDSEIYKG